MNTLPVFPHGLLALLLLILAADALCRRHDRLRELVLAGRSWCEAIGVLAWWGAGELVRRHRSWLIGGGSLLALKLLLAGRLAGFLVLAAVACLLPGPPLLDSPGREEEDL